MRNIIFYFAITSMMACSIKPTFFNQYKDRQIYSRKYNVSDENEARKMIQNRLDFLHRLYKPSPDPVAESSIITPQCIKENRIGSLYEDSKTIMAASTLHVDHFGNVGVCASDFKTRRMHSIYLFCKGDNYVLDLQFKYEPDFEPKVGGLEFCAN